MTKGYDQKYLKEDQYKDQSNLQARINLHQRFSENKADYFQWVLQQIPIQSEMRILDVGCGTGELWKRAFGKLPGGVRVVIGDLSYGMVSATAKNLSNNLFAAVNLDARRLPFPAGTFDIVIANHMLYHVPDINLALAEIKRVLIPGGLLIATTNGQNHLVEIQKLVHEFGTGADSASFSHRFSLENAAEYLGRQFENVKVTRMPGDLWVTETQPLVDYVTSMDYFSTPDEDLMARMAQRIEREIAEKGGFRIQKSGGISISN
ncbi:MAG TPA: class I SAM-dependent methyltransferase [Bellilinea sp.]|nr:class I SAM-dependent methyltransferase [Bellilinea sp.]